MAVGKVEGGALLAYLVPQEASQSHQTAITTHAVETTEHHEKQGNIGDKCANGAEFDVVQVEYTVVYLRVPGRVELQIKRSIRIQKVRISNINDYSPAWHLRQYI